MLALPVVCYLASIGECHSSHFHIHSKKNTQTCLGLGLYIANPSPNWDLHSREISSAFTFIALGVNVMVTALISFRLLRARKAMAGVLPRQHLRVYERVVTILIESALPPTVFGIGYAVSLLLPLRSTQEYVTQAITSTFFSMTYFAFAVSKDIISRST